jgi:hypothetical protein
LQKGAAMTVHSDAFLESVARLHARSKMALPAMQSIGDVKEIRDLVAVMTVCAGREGNVKAVPFCKRIRIRCERRWGQLYRTGKKARAGRPISNPSIAARDYRGAPTLKSRGVSYSQSARWQALADLSNDEFELALSRRLRRCGGQASA